MGAQGAENAVRLDSTVGAGWGRVSTGAPWGRRPTPEQPRVLDHRSRRCRRQARDSHRIGAKLGPQTQEKEPGAIHYEFWLSDDDKTIHLFEFYKDSAAVMTHLGNVGPHLPALMECLVEPQITVYGSPDETVRGAFADFQPTYMTKMAVGFSR